MQGIYMNDSLIHIDRYFNGEMTAGEKKLFEDRCLADKGFASEVARYILMRESAKESWAQGKKKEFAEFEETGQSSLPVREMGKIRTIKTWKQLAVAASLIGIIFIGAIVYLQNKKNDQQIAGNTGGTPKLRNDSGRGSKYIVIDSGTSPGKTNESRWREMDIARQDLVTKNFKLDAVPKKTEGILAEAFDQYNRRNFKSANNEYDIAIAQLKDVSLRAEEDEKEAKERRLLLFYAYYYSGLSYFAAGDTHKALAEFNSIKETPDKFWRYKVYWYQALAYLKAGDTKKAETLLDKIAGSKNAQPYQQNAAVLLNEIKSLGKTGN